MMLDRPLLTRVWLEVATALVLAGVGVAIVLGALEYKIGWDDGGPQPGYFPFYVGLVVTVGAVGAGFQALARPEWRRMPVVTREQGRRVASFFGPVVAFVALCSVLGIYVALAIYLVAVTRLQGGYGWVRSLAIGLGIALAFFVLFELLFGQPLLKGPLEAWFGFE